LYFINVRHLCSYFSCTNSLLRFVFSFRDGKLSDLLRTITCLTLTHLVALLIGSDTCALSSFGCQKLIYSSFPLRGFSVSCFNWRYCICLRRCFVILNLYSITVKPVYPTTYLFCTIPEIIMLFCDVISKNAVATNQRFEFIIHTRTTSDTYEERIVSTPCSGSTVINSLHVCVLASKEAVRE